MDQGWRNSLVVVFLCLISVAGLAAKPYAENGVFVKIKNQKALAQIKGEGIQSLEKISNLNTDLVFVHVTPGASIEKLLNSLAQNPNVEYATPNYFRYAGQGHHKAGKTQSPFPIDKPAAPVTWVNDPKGNTEAVSLSNVKKAWEKFTIGDPKIIIASIDTGVDYNHTDLAGNMWHNTGEEGLDSQGHDKRTNGIDDDGNGFVDDFIGWNFLENNNLPYDDYGHGTHTSGIAAAVGGNGFGLSGVCPRCSIMALRFLNGNGGTDEDAIKAINYAVQMGARVLNCSWGGDEDNPALRETMKAAGDKGVLITVAAGNEGEDLNLKAFYPARYNLPAQVTVAALNPVNVFIPYWSNFGSSYVHLSQAGKDVRSTVPGNGFEGWDGTSMATPGISGIIGMIWSYRPELKASEIKKLMGKNVYGDSDSMNKTIYGGRPNLYGILQKL